VTDERRSIDESLSRMSEALLRPGLQDREMRATQRTGPGSASAAFAIFGVTLFVAAAKTHQPWLIFLSLPLVAAGAMGTLRFLAPRLWTTMQGGPPSSARARIGMGATIAQSAVIEPGASVEMGATIGRGAVVRSGAVVRMGATVSRDAVVEAGAIVSWGAVVNRGAVVGERAVVGAGSVVRQGGRVPPGMQLSPGTVYAGDAAALPAPIASTSPAVARARPADGRDERLAAVCDKLEAELRSSPEQARAFLGGSDLTISSLRRTCEDLSRRERAMREEANPDSVARLGEERAALEKQLASEQDEQLRGSLRGAVAAIDEVKRQRELLRVGAERLQAEHTRLLYTLEGLASQLVRLRTAGATAAPGELSQSVLDLRARIDAIADALEEVSREAPSAMRELATGPAEEAGDAAPRGARTRE
jgi:carbonic anhydrase/acetyltransferase-like protein (isoleucine patch superfamily)